MEGLIPGLPPSDLTICGGGALTMLPIQLQNYSQARTILPDGCHTNIRSYHDPSTPTQFIFGVQNMSQLVSIFLSLCASYEFWSAGKTRVWIPVSVIIYQDLVTDEGKLKSAVKDIKHRLSSAYLGGLSLSSELYIVFPINNYTKSYSIEVYGISNDTLVVQRIPRFSSFNNKTIGMAGRRGNFHKTAVVRAGTARDHANWLVPPKPIYGTSRLNRHHNINNPLEILEDGTAALAFSEVAFALNFTSTLTPTDWLSRHSNGTLKGKTVALFQSRDIDVFLGMSSLLPYRATELAFLQPIYSDMINGFFIQPEASSLRDLVLATFSASIWAVLGILYILIWFSFIPVARRLYMSHEDATIYTERASWILGTICQQSWHVSPTSVPLRIIFLVVYITGLMVYVAFSASIVSVLSVQTVPINSRSALLSSSLTMYADSKSSTMAIVVKELMATTKAKFGPPVSIQRGIEKLRNVRGGVTYLAFPHYFYLIAANSSLSEGWICSYLSSIPVTLSPTPHAMTVYKNSPYYESFNYVLIKRFERGQHHRFTTIFNRLTSTRCLKGGGGKAPSIQIGDVFSSYAILCTGLCGSLVILMVERFWRLRRYNVPSNDALMEFKS